MAGLILKTFPLWSQKDFEQNTVPMSVTWEGRRELVYGMGAASLSGIIWFIACPKFDLWFLAWIAMIPTLVAIERASTIRRAVLFGWLAAVVGNAGGFYWLVDVLQRFGNLSLLVSILLFLLFCSYQALRFLLFTLLFCGIRSRTNLPAALVAPLVMVTAELCVPFIFPYFLAITQAQQLHVIQIADLTGPLGVTALLFMINGALYEVAFQRRRVAAAGIAIFVLLGVLVYGHLRIKQFTHLRTESPKIMVGVVQPNIAFDQKSIGGKLMNNLSDIQEQSRKLEQEGAQLIVWPETIYPSYIWRQVAGDTSESELLRIRRGFRSPLIFGARTSDLSEDTGYYNSALMLEQSGLFSHRYDKSNLVMFGEYMPGAKIFPSLQSLVPDSVGNLIPGRETVSFAFHSSDGRIWRLGPMICVEDTMPVVGRKLAKLRPHLLVNLTDDSWFGDTSEPWQHLSLSVYRSIELRTEMVRAVNPGVSAFVDATGQVYAKTYSVNPTTHQVGADRILGEVALIEGGHTIYATVGDLFGYACVMVTFGLWSIRTRFSRKILSAFKFSGGSVR